MDRWTERGFKSGNVNRTKVVHYYDDDLIDRFPIDLVKREDIRSDSSLRWRGPVSWAASHADPAKGALEQAHQPSAFSVQSVQEKSERHIIERGYPSPLSVARALPDQKKKGFSHSLSIGFSQCRRLISHSPPSLGRRGIF